MASGGAWRPPMSRIRPWHQRCCSATSAGKHTAGAVLLGKGIPGGHAAGCQSRLLAQLAEVYAAVMQRLSDRVSLVLTRALRFNMLTVTLYLQSAFTMSSCSLFTKKSILASVSFGGAPCFLRGACLTQRRVKADLSRPRRAAISEGGILSLPYQVLARRISSSGIFSLSASGVMSSSTPALQRPTLETHPAKAAARAKVLTAHHLAYGESPLVRTKCPPRCPTPFHQTCTVVMLRPGYRQQQGAAFNG